MCVCVCVNPGKLPRPFNPSHQSVRPGRSQIHEKEMLKVNKQTTMDTWMCCFPDFSPGFFVSLFFCCFSATRVETYHHASVSGSAAGGAGASGDSAGTSGSGSASSASRGPSASLQIGRLEPSGLQVFPGGAIYQPRIQIRIRSTNFSPPVRVASYPLEKNPQRISKAGSAASVSHKLQRLTALR